MRAPWRSRWLVAAAPNGDVEGAEGGVRYFDLHDRLAARLEAGQVKSCDTFSERTL